MILKRWPANFWTRRRDGSYVLNLSAPLLGRPEAGGEGKAVVPAVPKASSRLEPAVQRQYPAVCSGEALVLTQCRVCFVHGHNGQH